MSLKTGDRQVDAILYKMHKNAYKTTPQINQRYSQAEKIEEDSRIINYKLQDENLQLRKELKKLERILNAKMKSKQKLDQTDAQIQDLREKLKSVLNSSQSLQQSLVKIRKPKQNHSMKIVTNQCCCSRRNQSPNRNISVSPSKSIHSHRHGHHKDNKGHNRRHQISIPNAEQAQKCSFPFTSIILRQSVQTQCQPAMIGTIERVADKKAHVEKLKSLVQQQERMIKQYETSLYSQASVGKIKKASDLREMRKNSSMRTCASFGSITKANRLTDNQM